MISIVDCGIGNLGSVQNMLKHVGAKSCIVSDIEDVVKAEKLILPGVGSWDNGVSKLRESGLLEVLNVRVLKDKTPILGICLGMQLLLESSEEGKLAGLGWINGRAKKFTFNGDDDQTSRLRIPHMGWNIVQPNCETPITKNFKDESRFYFVHSYHACDIANENILMTSHYGYDFVCAVHQENIFGVQFHPEKSHKFGMQLMKNFMEL